MIGSTRRIVLGIGAAAIAVALAGVTFAAGQNSSPAQGPGFGPGGQGPGRFGGPGGPGGPMGRGRGGPGGPGLGPLMLGRLELSDAQKTRVKEIMDSHRDDEKALADRGFAARNALELAISGDTFDEGKVRTLAAEVGAVEADVAVARARTYAEVFQILTPDQQAQVKKQRADMQARESQMRQNREQRREQRH